jgi:D-lyxose ketol-isomerase
MYARRGQETPCHTHAREKEDVVRRAGQLALRLWPAKPAPGAALAPALPVPVGGEAREVATGSPFTLEAASRVTLRPGVWHAFGPESEECIIGEVSAANDDVGDNFFLDPRVGRFPGITEDEPAAVRLLVEQAPGDAGPSPAATGSATP